MCKCSLHNRILEVYHPIWFPEMIVNFPGTSSWVISSRNGIREQLKQFDYE